MKSFDPLALPVRETQLIEASAGTGKTYTITNLVLKLLLGRDDYWQRPLAINEILVLTFTIAATDELKHRIAGRIRDARLAYREGSDDGFLQTLVASSTDPARDQKLLTAASRLMDEAAVFTIHGFCARVLDEQSFESGMLFDQELNAERDQILQLAAEDCFRKDILTLPPEYRSVAFRIWSNPESLAFSLRNFLFRGELNVYPPRAADVDSEFKALLAKTGSAKTAWLEGDVRAVIEAANLHLRRKPMLNLDKMDAYCAEPDVDPTSEFWQIYSRESLEASQKKLSHMPVHPALDLIDDIATSRHVIQTVENNLWHDMLEKVAGRIQRHKQDLHKLTLDDLLTELARAVTRTGSTLKETIASRWPVAMIDEFQDTDAIQYRIFSSIYHSRPDDHAFLMIGDPKQAIYSFRGADVYTYINARRAAAGTHSLQVNWRTTPALIEATNYLFNRSGIFDPEDIIPFERVTHADTHAEMKITEGGKTLTPYQVFWVGAPDEFLYMAPLRERVMEYAAEETVRLLNGSARGDILIDGEPLHAGQIAFLVRQRRDAEAAKAALARRDIQSVYLTLESVFLQDTADDVKLILEAVMEPGSDHAIRAALGCNLMQATMQEINALNEDVQLQQQVLEEFQYYHELWQDKDVAPMLNTLIRHRRLAEKWLSHPDGERQLTNLRHLIEILQERSIRAEGMHRLIKWFSQQQREAETVAEEERQLRLESDENLVKIVTMHAAKGLEYDIVMIPMPQFPHIPEYGPVLFHERIEDDFVAALELGDDETHRAQHELEQQAEDMRLLYVAMTRAKYRCYLGLPKSRDLARSAYAGLIGIDELHAKDSLIDKLTLPDFFEVVDGNGVAVTPFEASKVSGALQAPPTPPSISDIWRIHSYSSVAQRLSSEETPVTVLATGFTDDDSDETDAMRISGLSRFSFPRGTRVGIALHSLMEDIDFTDPEEHESLCERALLRLGLPGDWLPVLSAWVADILSTELEKGLRLDTIGRADRLDEMEFHFPLSASPDLLSFLSGKGYIGESADKLQLEGMMTGLIDLTFRHGDRYFIVDYKSNHLGNRFEDYAEDKLVAAMKSHRYDLQYLIYTVALNKILTRKLATYDYDRHFGGVYYLFLRGMQPASGSGVYFAKPEAAVIDSLDELLSS